MTRLTALEEARIKLAAKIYEAMEEGKMTGASPTQTGAMTGRFMRRLKRSVASGETDPEVLDQKKAQAKRIRHKTAARQAKYAPSHGADPGATYANSKDRFTANYYKAQYGSGAAPEDAPNPTDVKRRAQGQEPYPKR